MLSDHLNRGMEEQLERVRAENAYLRAENAHLRAELARPNHASAGRHAQMVPRDDGWHERRAEAPEREVSLAGPGDQAMTVELNHVRVHDVMHSGILSCTSDAPLKDFASIMARHHVHFVAVSDGRSVHPTAVLSDLDLVAAIASRAEPTASRAAATKPLAVSADERLDRAAQLMGEHGVSHLLVLDAADGHPIGVLSTLDIAEAYAGAEVER